MTPHLILSSSSFSLLLHFLLLLSAASSREFLTSAAAGGQWDLLHPNIGITAMHMQLLNNDRVVIFDRTDFGPSNISLADGKCRSDPLEKVLKIDCTAHSVEYDVASNTIRPLMVLTDVWCSSGSLTPNGRLVQTGGFNDGDHAVRFFNPCSNCDWEEISSGLVQRRWYATNHILPDGRQIIIGGRRQYNYEFYPKSSSSSKAYSLPFLVQTNDPGAENNLYPFVYLNLDGHLFIFANNRAILFDYAKNLVVKTYPPIPGGDPRSYPSTGSSVLLPLQSLQGVVAEAEVLVCGGAPKSAFNNARRGTFDGALNSCGRMKITDPEPNWAMETMPMGRVMGDMVMLPNGHVLIINGGSSGTAGWEYGRSPVLSPLIYGPNNPVGDRFKVQNPSNIPRMYHSTALLLRDGRVLTGGSNPHEKYNFVGLFPTELRLEAFSPSYLDPSSANLRPTIISPISQTKIKHGQQIVIQFTVPGRVEGNLVSVTMVAPSFVTHSFSMNQRLLVLGNGNIRAIGKLTYQTGVIVPRSGNVAPSGYYLLFVVHQEIPSEGIWVQIQ